MIVVEYIVKQIKKEGIEYVFGYQGGNITYLVDAIARESGIYYNQSYNEQGAAFAANTYAQVSGNFGVAVSSSGPGAINLMNGIANAYYDSVPVLFITGNINTATMKTDAAMRQNGFQEADIVSMVKGITKYAKTIMSVEEIVPALTEAFAKMMDGRKGPVLLDIPHDIQRSSINEAPAEWTMVNNPDIIPKHEYINKTIQCLKKSKKPIFLIGNGCRSTQARSLLASLTEDLCIPIISSLNGIDACPANNPNYIGMIGTFGLDSTNRVLEQADCVVAIGSRMDERQRYANGKDLFDGKSIVHVEIDQSEMRHINAKEFVVPYTVEAFLKALIARLDDVRDIDYGDWHAEVLDVRKSELDKYILGKKCADQLRKVFDSEIATSYIIDVGCHQMAAAQVAYLKQGDFYLNSAGLGSMGFSIPGAIGAYYANKSGRIVAICGDGGFMMNLQELQWIKREKLPITIVVVNNRSLQMIANYQRLAFDGRTVGSEQGYESPDIQKIAAAFGFDYYKANDENLSGDHRTPTIIEIEV